MPLNAGSCSVSPAPANIVTGTGLAKALAEASFFKLPDGATPTKVFETWMNRLAVAIVNHLVANASITVTIGTSDGGLQRTPNPNDPDAPTAAPAAPVVLTGKLT